MCCDDRLSFVTSGIWTTLIMTLGECFARHAAWLSGATAIKTFTSPADEDRTSCIVHAVLALLEFRYGHFKSALAVQPNCSMPECLGEAFVCAAYFAGPVVFFPQVWGY